MSLPRGVAIRYYNRYTKKLETEPIYGEKFLRWVYETPLGKTALHTIVKRLWFSQWYGWRMHAPSTKKKIRPFLDAYSLNETEFLESVENYQSFNAFFYRKLKPEARPITGDNTTLIFPADGRHLGFQNLSESTGFFIKGQRLDLDHLLQNPTLANRYREGTFILSRLCPLDYHRFHFPCAGTPQKPLSLPGPLFSVNPIALRKNLRYLCENKRMLTQISTEHVGEVLFIEIGATCVGRITQTFTPYQNVNKGEEKGFFQFGGSSIITLFEPGTVKLAEDLVTYSSKNTEIYAHMGDTLGSTL